MVIILGVMCVIGGGIFVLMTAENRMEKPQKAGLRVAVEPKRERIDGLD